MSTQENNIDVANGFAGTDMNPPLVNVMSQLSPDQEAAVSQPTDSPAKPQVVFVEQQRETKFIEIHVESNTQPTASEPASAEPELALEPVVQAPVASTAVPVPLARPLSESRLPEVETARFAIDPFVHQIDGVIPVMPTLPIIHAKTTTDEVVAREQSGDHYAWRLMPVPYPDEGNIPMFSEDETKQPAGSDSASRAQRVSKPAGAEAWTEVVAENNDSEHGDCFYAQSGDVIAIDGNKGFDHIDLRSYSIDDATFQPGTILLHSAFASEEADDGELPQPIAIRHRGVGFAIFSGEVRVEL